MEAPNEQQTAGRHVSREYLSPERVSPQLQDSNNPEQQAGLAMNLLSMSSGTYSSQEQVDTPKIPSSPCPPMKVVDPMQQLVDAAANSSPLSKEREEQLKRFQGICSLLRVDQEMQELAWKYICQIETTTPTGDLEKRVFASALYASYLTMKKRRTEGGEALVPHSLHLMELLKAVNLKMVDFFAPLKTFLEALPHEFGDFYEKERKRLEHKFVVIFLLFKKYDAIFRTKMNIADLNNRDSHIHSIYSFGWTLFLVCKNLLSSNDFITELHILVCCLSLVIAKAPQELRRIENHHTIESVLTMLCEENKVRSVEALKAYHQLFLTLLNILKTNQIIIHKQSDDFNEIVSIPYLSKNLININNRYDQNHEACDLDERYLINQIDAVGTPSKIHGTTAAYYNFPTPTKDTTNSTIVPATPLTTTLTTVRDLEKMLEETGSTPSYTLSKFFRECKVDFTEFISTLVQQLLSLVTLEEVDLNPKKELAVKYYYSVMERMLVEETKRNQFEFTNLLGNEIFHKSLLACSLEIIFFSYKITQMEFPYFLEKFSLKPFDFCKIIENVVRTDRHQLPKLVLKHLGSIEERILESTGWESGSPIFTLLSDPNHKQLLKQNLSQYSAIATPKAGTLVQLASPLRITNNRLHSQLPNSNLQVAGNNFQSPGSTLQVPGTNGMLSPAPQRRLPSTLDFFFRKLYKLAESRCLSLCSKLELSPSISHKVFTALIHLLIYCPELMENRHLDQMIICSIYGICKILQIDVSFKMITDKYKTYNPSKMFREVVMESVNSKADIIAFYNKFYILSMESYLTGLNAQPQNESVIGSNISLSPLRPRISQPHTRSFQIGESPQTDLSAINDRINSPMNTPAIVRNPRSLSSGRAKRRLNLDTEESEKKPKFGESSLNTLAHSASSFEPIEMNGRTSPPNSTEESK